MSVYELAIEKWGKEPQTDVAIEEMSELTKELIKNRRGKDNVKEIAEEIADVEIMLEQLKIIHDVSVSVSIVKNQKLERLERRIKGGIDDVK